VKFLQDFKLLTLSVLSSILSKVLQTSNLLSLFPPFTKTNHSSPVLKGCGNKYSQDSNRKLCPDKKAPNDLNFPFKENEKERSEGKSQLSGQWLVLMFDGPWKVPLFGGP
jgi:hypothetical protein